MKMITVMLMAVLSVSLFLVGLTSSAPYDPWIDLDDDGDIDIFDIVQMAGAYGTTGTPINKTELLLELAARLDLLNATVMALQGGYVAETGEFDGVVNADMVEKAGVTTINFNTPFTSVEKPGMVISVVLKHAANGLTEGSAIRVVEDVKGTSGNWYGFDLTVSKYSDGASIDDLTQVYVTWVAIGTESTSPARAYASTFSDSTDASGNVYVSYPVGKFAATPSLSVTVQFNSGGLAQMGYTTISSHTKDGFTLNVKDGSGSNWSSSAVQISYVAIQQ